MSTEDLVRVWKDPDHRAGYAGIDHPAGGIELASTGVGGEEETTTGICITIMFTCVGNCENSVSEGTCGHNSIGCC